MRTETPQPVRDALRELLGDTVRFVRAEMRVVKAEGVETGKRGALAAGILAGSAVLLLLAVIFLLGSAAAAIGGVLDRPWLGWLCIAGLTLVLAACLGLAGYRMLRRAIAAGKRVGATVKEDLEWVRELPRHSANGS